MIEYEFLKPYEQNTLNPEMLEKKITENEIVFLKGKKTSVLTGEGLGLKVNTSVGLNSQEELGIEQEKIKVISKHSVLPDIMMDLSAKRIHYPLYGIISDEIGCPVGTIPHYMCFSPKHGICKTELLEIIEEQAEFGVSFITLHLTADLKLAERAMMRKIPVISRGGSLLLRDMKINKRSENILINIIDEIISICKKHHVVINIGSTFRPSTLYDALDDVNIQEIDIQKKLCKHLISKGIHVQMEGLGHIIYSRIPEYVSIIRKDGYIPFMPLGPIVSDHTQGQDHITNAVGASYIAALGGADIINTVTREEHTGGIPNIYSIIEAIDAANVVTKIINNIRFPRLSENYSNNCHNCMGKSSITGCSRCGAECPFIWNGDVSL